MTYMLLPEKILFTCESTGVLVNPQWIDTSVLKDFDETIRVAERLKTLHCSYLISPHYGVVPPWFNQIYFDMYIQAAKKEKTFIESLIEEGKSFEQIMEAHKAFYWRPERAKAATICGISVKYRKCSKAGNAEIKINIII